MYLNYKLLLLNSYFQKYFPIHIYICIQVWVEVVVRVDEIALRKDEMMLGMREDV